MIYLFTVIYIKSMNITPHNKKLNLISYLETFILVIDSGRKIYQNIDLEHSWNTDNCRSENYSKCIKCFRIDLQISKNILFYILT